MKKTRGFLIKGGILCSLLVLFPSQCLIADPYLEVCGGVWCTTKGDAEGYNYICGSDNIKFSAIQLGVILPGGPTYTYDYQWYKQLYEWHNILGWRWFTYTMTGSVSRVITTNIEGKYYCHVKKYTNGILTADYETGKAQVVSISAQPSFSSQPVNPTSICLGSQATFSVTANQTGNNFQWKRSPSQGGTLTDISGATSPSYSFTPSASDDDYYYSCLVTNACNTSGNSSNQAKLIVLSPPVVSPQPASVSTCEKSLTTITASVTGDYSSLAWYVKPNGGSWTPISDAPTGYSGYNSLELTIQSPTKSHDLNQYKCRASLSSCGWWDDPSTVTTLHVYKEVSIISQSHNMPVCENGTASLSVVAQGDNLVYQWKRSSSPVFTSSTNVGSSSTLNFTPDPDFDGYYYKCELTQDNVCGGTDESMPVKLNITNSPVLMTNPESSEKCADQNTNFSVTASGTELNYIWQVNTGAGFVDLSDTANYSNTHTSTMTISGIRTYQDKNQYRCQVSGSCPPSVASEPATLSVNVQPVITQHPVNDSVCPGESISFSVLAEGGTSMEYKWKKGGVGITDWVSFNSITLDEVTLFDDQEKILCLVRNECAFNNPAESDEAVIKVWPRPSKPNLNAEENLCPGDSMVLDPGSGYVSYEWNTGALTRTLTVYDGGLYKVTVTNEKGCWNDGKVYVNLDPAIPEIDLGGDRSYCAGEEPTLDAGPGYDVYLWKDGSSGQTLKPLTTGSYWVTANRNNSVCIVSDTVSIDIVEPYDGDQICIVTVDSVSGKNMVVWEKTEGEGIDSYNVWREGSTVNDSILVANVAFNTRSVAIDEGSEPESKAHRYWITALDTCGNESLRSKIHKTMLLTTGLGPDRINLSWLEYEVENQPYLFVGYKIFRSPINNSFLIIDSISSGSPLYPDIDPPDGTNYYRIAGLIDTPCNPDGPKKEGTAPYKHSLSNMDDNKLKDAPSGIIYDVSSGVLEIYPNPFDNYTMLRYQNPAHSEYTLFIRDLSGKLVRTKPNITEQEIRINRESLKPGYYHVELRGENLYRGKMIIQ